MDNKNKKDDKGTENIYALAKKLAEFIGSIDKKRNETNDK